MSKFQTAAAFLALAAISLAPVESSAVVRALLVDETDTCVGTCDEQDQKERFCGIDSICRPYSCQSWYEYGPRNFTGYDESFPEPLICQDMTVGPEVFYTGVQYGCYETNPTRIKLGFTKACKATPAGPSTSFTCYEMATTTNFQPYLDGVTNSGLTCKNDSEIPTFSYYASYSLQNNSGRPYTGYTVVAPAADSTISFNASLGMGTMYSEFRIEEALSPSPTESPTANPSSAFAMKPIIWACAFICLYHL
jgi:hypothetical protein